MNREEIRNVLLELAGEGLLPDRGVGADDILLADLDSLPNAERLAFWRNFGTVLRDIWVQGEVEAFLNASVFIARIPQAGRPAGEEAQRIAGFLLDDEEMKKEGWGARDELRLVVAGLRILAALGLGERIWWRVRFNSWLDQAKTRQDGEALYAWQAVLHASRGLLSSGEVAPNFDAWFLAAQAVQDFPSLEVFTLLADQSASPSVDKDALKEEVLEAYKSLYARCYRAPSCPQGIQELKAVIGAWLEDRVGMKPDEADHQLAWKKPDLRPPSVRLREPVEEMNHCSPV